ncbi:MAG: UvrD-helicase domain-containing protein, partial [Gammaproteobacteria bacterium]|nr:UvrD-helicase domain-containing protein [Gammaproteobacteria bacterium]
MSFIELTAENTLDFPQVGVHLIEASAGTGKTYTVTNLYLNNIIAGKKVSEILVVTFTIAATDELRGRIRNRLYEVLQMLENGQGTNDSYLVNLATKLAQENCVDRAINYLKLAVRSMDEAAIYTIHGFCQRILNEFSFLSGQQFEMDFLNDDTDLWRQAIRDWWRKTAYPLPTATGLFFIQVLSDVNSFYRLVKPFLSTVNPLILPEPVGWDSLESSWDRMGIALNDVASNWTQKSETIKNTLLTSKGLSRAKTKPYQKDRLEAAFVRLDDYFDECLNSGAPVFPVPEFELLTRRCINDSLLKTKDEDLYDAFYDQC